MTTLKLFGVGIVRASAPTPTKRYTGSNARAHLNARVKFSAMCAKGVHKRCTAVECKCECHNYG